MFKNNISYVFKTLDIEFTFDRWLALVLEHEASRRTPELRITEVLDARERAHCASPLKDDNNLA